MDWMKSKWLWAAGAVAVIVIAWVCMGQPAMAADLGGNCCADLEERIAELEATAAKKGNSKVSLRVYGRVDRMMSAWDDMDAKANLSINGTQVGAVAGTLLEGGSKIGHDNSNRQSFVGFAGKAKINSDLSAGFVIEIATSDYDLLFGESTNGIYVYKQYVFLKSEQAGSLTLGLASSATDGIDELSTVDIGAATRPLSFRPVVGPSGATELFDGSERNLIRYDSPALQGFQATASYSTADAGVAGADTDLWEVALRYAGEFGGFQVVGGLGYSDGEGTTKQTYMGAASVKHIASGIFVTGNYGHAEWDSPFAGSGEPEVDGYAVTAGIESKPVNLGKTVLYGEWGQLDGDWSIFSAPGVNFSLDAEATYYGGGIVQNIDAAAMQLFVSFRMYEAEADITGKMGVTSGKLHGEIDSWLVGGVGASIQF